MVTLTGLCQTSILTPNVLVLSDTLKQALLSQTCCNMPELCEFLEGEIDFLYSCQPITTCSPLVAYLNTHLALIEAAQIFARNKIDTQIRIASFQLSERYTAHEDRLTEGESTATGRSCNWAGATSQQFFNRDSTDDTVAFHEANGQHTSDRNEFGYDLSTRRTSGTGFHFSRVIHTLSVLEGESNGIGNGQNNSRSVRVATNAGGTGPLVPLGPTQWNPTPFFTITPPFFNIGPPTGLPPSPGADYPDSGLEACIEEDPDNPGFFRCPFIIRSSYGYGYQGNFKVSIGIPAIGVLSVDFSQGRNERQYFHCSSGTVIGDSTHTMAERSATVARTTAQEPDNRSSSRETTTVIHLVRKHGTSTRRGLDTIDAEDHQVGVADGRSHSESARDSKGQDYQQRRKEEQTVKNAETHLRHTEEQRDDDSRIRFGQISEHLAALWKRVFHRLTILERQLAAKPVGCSMNCNCNRQGCNLCFGRRTHYA